MLSPRHKQPLYVLLAILLAVACCFLIRQMMPETVKPKALKVIDAEWITESDAGRENSTLYPLKLGYTIHSQLPDGVKCCAGTYVIKIGSDALKAGINTQQPAIFLPAIGGDFKILLNGVTLNVPKRSDYSSVGPLIPLKIDQAVTNLKIEITLSGTPTPYNGLWKAPLLIGDYYDLFNYMEADRRSQIVIPTLNGICMVLFAGLFLFLYRVTQKQAGFFLSIGVAFFFYALFDFYLSGFVRHQHLYFGFVTHYPVRGLVGIGTFLIVVSFLDIISDSDELVSAKERKLTYGVIIALAIVNLILGVLGYWVTIVWMVSLSLVLSFWPLLRWPFRKSVSTWYGFLTIFVVFFAFLSTTADSFKLVSRLFQVQLNYGYFTRYTTVILIVSAIFLSAVFFRKIFVTIEKERIRLMKSQGVSRAIKMLAHDVRKPFQILKLGLNVLESRPLEAKNDYAKKLKLELAKHTDNVDSMLSDIMEFGATCRLTIEEANIAELLRDVVLETAPLYEHKHIEVKTELAEGLVAAIDRLKIKRVVQNILNNAFQAVASDGLVKVSARQGGSGKVLMEIFNTKSFLSEDKRKRIFDEFYTSDKADGTGLGLAIAKEFVEAHGGRIWCGSVKGEGTWFWVEL